MFDDEAQPKRTRPPKPVLDGYSLDELEDYIAEMRAEIERAQAEIAKKKAHMDAASSIFKS